MNRGSWHGLLSLFLGRACAYRESLDPRLSRPRVQSPAWPLSGCRHGSLTVGRTPTKEALASSRVSQGSTSSMPTLCPQAASTLQAGNAFHRSFISCWAWGSCPKHMCAGAGGSAGPLASIGCTQGHSLSRTESGRVAWGRKGICLGTTCGESRNGTESSVNEWITSVQFSRSVVSDSLRPHELQHARPPCPSPTPGVHSNSCASSL